MKVDVKLFATLRKYLPADAKNKTVTLTLSDGRATIEERRAERPDARISGDRSAWIGAFSPDRDRGGLSVTGDSELAHRALDGLMCAADGAGAQRAVA